MIPRLKLQDWHDEVAERGERETARLEALWAEYEKNAVPEIDVGEEGIESEAFALLGEPERALVRRALIEGLCCAMRSAYDRGDYAAGDRARAFAEALEPSAASIGALVYWDANGGGMNLYGSAAIGLAARGVQPYKAGTHGVHTPNPPAWAHDEQSKEA